MIVRCFYGSGVQQHMEEHGLAGWCDKHCTAGYMRALYCYQKVKSTGIDPETGRPLQSIGRKE